MSFRLDMNELLGREVDLRLRSGRIVSKSVKKKDVLFRSCDQCPLKDTVKTPMMKPFGKFEKEAMFVGEAPGREEDKRGRPFCGQAGNTAERNVKACGFDFVRDFKLSNVVQCRPPKNKFPKPFISRSCFKLRLEKQILKYKPKLIVAAGLNAVEHILELPVLKSSKGKAYEWTMNRLRGRLIPSVKYNCWVGCVWHPSFVNRMNDAGYSDYEKIFKRDLKYVLDNGFDMKELNFRLELGRRENKGNIILTDCDRVLEVLDELTNNRKMTKYCIDFETIGLDIFSDKFKVLTVGISKNKRKAYCIPIEFPADDEINWSGWNEDERQLVMDKLIEFFENPKMKIAQNKKFENMIIQKHFGVRPRNLSFDTMNATQALDSRGVTKLDVQTFFLTGKTYSDEVDVKRLNEFPLKTVAKYNCLDAKYPLIIMDKQCKSASTKQLLGINLLNNGADLFADMEMRGIGIDLDEVDRQIDWVDEEINTLDNYFLDSPFSLKYKKKNGKDINVGSTVQLQDLFYGIMGLNPVGNKSSAGKYSLDIKHLEELKTTIRDDELIKYVDGILRQRRLVKHKSTYLESWKEKSINGILHPSYGFFTETMRSNSENPNFQNIPERDEELKRIKKCIIPHLGDEFLEGDFKALEVCVIAMLSKDEVLINKIRNNVDFHREWAAKIFDKREEDITDEERFRVKNSFVFALFYGSWYESVYKDFVKFGFTDIPLKHFRRMEKELWKTFNGVKRWQNKEIDNYNRHGYVVMKTGFRRHGPLSLNKIINTPVQGTAFHLLLTSLIEMNKIMVGDRMKSGIVAETHDSVVIDTKREEREDVLALANKEMTKKRFKWMCVPLTISWQLGSNLFDMNKIKGAVNE